MKRYYLAYGSNLNIGQMKFRCPTARVVGTAEIDGYELLFKGSKSGSYLTIEPREGATVPVAVWEVQEQDELNLDRYEGFPTFYYKKEMRLSMQSLIDGTELGEVDAIVYIMQSFDWNFALVEEDMAHTSILASIANPISLLLLLSRNCTPLPMQSLS